ncbi:MAG TPA: shikimate kinase [Candidatus Eremiobacteraceae bacterium]|nr:shikimate kinase [Candidatus Eremiobacteraceae bacterium]
MNVWLTGFMGAGKTTTGRRLARILCVPFADTDAEIEREHGAIAGIFETAGESRFRALETSVIAALGNGAAKVIAVGGGAVVSASNRALMRAHGAIVHLSISPAGAYARVAHRSHRPLLGSEPELATIERVMIARADAYADCDYRVSVDGKGPASVAHIIARWYRRKTVTPHSNAR